jgi:site-specific DNA recombinase
MLDALQPKEDLFRLGKALFKKAWEHQDGHAASLLDSARQKIVAADKQIEQILDRIMESSNATVIEKYEKRIDELEKEKLLMQEKLQIQAKPRGTFDEMFELAMQFLANPRRIWDFGKLEYKRTVLKLAFSERVAYCRKTGLRTPETSSVFGLFGAFLGGKEEMVTPTGLEPVLPP